MGSKIHRSLTNSNGSQTKISISDKIARQLTSKKVHFYYILELEALAVRKCKDICLGICKKVQISFPLKADNRADNRPDNRADNWPDNRPDNRVDNQGNNQMQKK